MEASTEPFLWKSEPEVESIVSVTLARSVGALLSTRTKRLMDVISRLSPHGQTPQIGSLEDSLLFLHRYVSDAAEKNNSLDQVLVPMIQNSLGSKDSKHGGQALVLINWLFQDWVLFEPVAKGLASIITRRDDHYLLLCWCNFMRSLVEYESSVHQSAFNGIRDRYGDLVNVLSNCLPHLAGIVSKASILQDGFEFPTRLGVSAADCFLTLTESLLKVAEVHRKKLKSNARATNQAIALLPSPTGDKKVKPATKSLQTSKIERDYILWHHLDELICLVQRLLAWSRKSRFLHAKGLEQVLNWLKEIKDHYASFQDEIRMFSRLEIYYSLLAGSTIASYYTWRTRSSRSSTKNCWTSTCLAFRYRMLVYLKYCFTGLAFPPGRGTISPARLASLRKELVQFLLEDSNFLKSQTITNLRSRGPHLNLYLLLELDTEATLDVLRCAFVEDETSNAGSSALDSTKRDIEHARNEICSISKNQNVLVQSTVDALIHILDKDVVQTDIISSSGDEGLVKIWPSKKDIGHVFEFIAYYVALQKAKVSRSVLCQILEYLTSESYFQTGFTAHDSSPKKREKQALALLEVLPESDWDASYVLDLCKKAQFHQVCGLIHTIRHEYVAAMDSYMKDVDEPIHAFSFIHKTLLQLTDSDRAAIRSAVISRIPELVELSREGAFHMVISHFSSESSQIMTELRSHPKSLFHYLKTVIEVHLSGTLDFSNLRKDDVIDAPGRKRMKDHPQGLHDYLENISNFPKHIRDSPIHVTDDLIELYLELLCQYEGDSVLKFLEMFDSYRVEHCLRLCQEYRIIDAAAFLLERVGDVGSALSLVLSGLDDKFVELDAAVEAVVSNRPSSGSSQVEVFSTFLRMKEVNDICNILNACISLCQRNTPRLNPEESEAHWFRLLDSICEPLMDSYDDERKHVGPPAGSANSLKDEDRGKSRWKISKSHNGAHVLRKLFAQFIKEIVEGMIGYVHLPTIMSKLLSDNGSQEFGDFKLTILGMLGTYGFERRILDSAKSLIEDDTFYTLSLLKRGASHGYAPRDSVCCICNGLLTENSFSSGIRVFNCGHAIHLQCEVSESESSTRGSPSGCPVCMPNKKSQRSRNKFISENGLVTQFSSRRQNRHGSTVHSHDSDLLESIYGPHQISRFEILSGLRKDQKFIQMENLPQLRLAPPSLYHEKVTKVTDMIGETSDDAAVLKKQNSSRQLRDLRAKGSSLNLPLKTSIFGKMTSKR